MRCERHELTLPLVYQRLSLRQRRAPGALRQTNKDAPKDDREKEAADGDGDGDDDYGRMTKTVACRVPREKAKGAWLSGYLGGGKKVWVAVARAHVEL